MEEAEENVVCGRSTQITQAVNHKLITIGSCPNEHKNSLCRSAFGSAPAYGSVVLVLCSAYPGLIPSSCFPPQPAKIAVWGPPVAELGISLGYLLPRPTALVSGEG
jgi:hypothetical protein